MKILIAGEGGQGVQLISNIIADCAYRQKINTSIIPHYGVEMRMGISFAYIQLAKENIYYPKFAKADLLVVMSKRQIEIPKNFIDKKTLIINAISLDKIIKNNGLSPRSLNMLVLGIIVKELSNTEFALNKFIVKEEIKNKFAEKNELLSNNIKSYEFGLLLDKTEYDKNLSNIKQNDFLPIVDNDKDKIHVKFPDLCKGCGLCILKCPVSALSWSEDKINYILKPIPKLNLSKCISCM
ncbi:MAG: 2-oxoacid:acceptor oxidoreductase family protein, partial [Candidatus Woesearchaeota archaeon]